MSLFGDKLMWKCIIVHNKEKNTAQFFYLDKQQRITPKLKHKKKRSIQLAKIGYYENDEIKKLFKEIAGIPAKKSTNKPKTSDIENMEKNESQQIVNQIKSEEFTNIYMDPPMNSEEYMDYLDNNIFDYNEKDFSSINEMDPFI